jgi:hypothetical protein
MRKLSWSKELKRVVELPDTLTADEALDVLVRELLGENYYIVDPVHSHQANVIIVEDILKKYKKR